MQASFFYYGSRLFCFKFRLVINAESLKEAQLKACAKVNAENEKASTMTATIMADIRIAAGCTVKIAGLGHISGKYFVDQVTHNIGADSGYTMDLEMHRCQRRISQVSPSTWVIYICAFS